MASRFFGHLKCFMRAAWFNFLEADYKISILGILSAKSELTNRLNVDFLFQTGIISRRSVEG